MNSDYKARSRSNNRNEYGETIMIGDKLDPLRKTEITVENLAEIPASIYSATENIIFYIKKGGAGAVNLFTRELVWLVRRERELLEFCSETEKADYNIFCAQLTKIAQFPTKKRIPA